MPRDDDYIRELLTEAALSESNRIIVSATHDRDPASIKRSTHAEWLEDIKYFQKIGHMYRITSQGYDYYAAISDDTIWSKTKEGAATVGVVGLGIMKDIAVGYARQKLTEMGIPLN